MTLSDPYGELYLDLIYQDGGPETRAVVDRFAPMIQTNLYPPVKTKTDMVQRYARGEFGNCSPTWNSPSELFTDKPNRRGEDNLTLYHIRNRIVGGQTWYNVPRIYLLDKWQEHRLSWPPQPDANFYISEMAPKHLLNGELMRTHEGLVLFYSTVQKPMRDSLREGGREAKGLTAKFILQHYMNQRSYDWTMLLLDRYPDHVIEFTVVDRCWGTVPGFNTLFWEVRKNY